ncbi:putative C2H2 transcription factor [Aspergillus ibericus CBS 121593]|uniref:C2H2 transcription factor n=1 Tax=Aspergillus ibericus CBS 121593 TaxID=1448316 RepID=A0A395H0Y0_9EURO|nr:C2H2 transcription factor [Aspergillus ibericus CBS 121593]RAL00895.1 C2H2 transcription factor [Aspergillus ibericus CBS 121593]
MSPEKSDAGQETVTRLEAEGPTNNDSSSHNRDTPHSSTATGQTKCSICQSTFRRPEHLKRHFRSHTKEKPFECAQCGRHFSRTDTLHRHELSHHNAGMEGGKDRTHRITVKTFRACYKCAIARVRCSGGSPCTRCENRSLECQYPTERRSKAKARKEAQASLANDDASYGQSPHPIQSTLANGSDLRPSRNGERSMPPPFQYQVTQFQLQMPVSSVSGTVASNVPATADGFELGKRSSDELRGNGQASAMEETSRSVFSSSSDREIQKARGSFHQYAGVGLQDTYSHVATSTEKMAESAHQSKSFHTAGEDPNGIATVRTVENQQVRMELMRPLSQSTLSTINWLPQNPLDSNDHSHPLNSSYPKAIGSKPPDVSLNQTAWFPSITDSSPMASENVSRTPSGNTSLGGNTESPSQISQSKYNNATQRAGDHFMDGAVPGFSNFRRERDAWSGLSTVSADASIQLQRTNGQPQFLFPILPEARVHAANEDQNDRQYPLEPSTYHMIHNAFVQMCSTDNFLYPKFESNYFPDAKILSSFIYLYFDNFQPVYPIFHLPTFDLNKCHWLVVLTLSAIGCHFAGLQEQSECAPAFHEFLRRAITVEKEKCYEDRAPIWLLQAITLNCVGLLYSYDERARVSALNSFGDLIGFVTHENLLGHSDKSMPLTGGQMHEQTWESWIEDEIRRRTGYFIWLLDCTIAYHFDKRPLLSLDDGQAKLPSHEILWKAQSSGAWQELRERVSGQEEVSLYDAVLVMYIEKKLVPDIGEFSQVLLVHALYHRMWEVGDYFRRPLSFWNPTSKKQSRHSAIPPGSVWLPGVPSYSKWRNSACDCLDILHWAASSAVARAAGLEHPTILHLHSARIVLLAPFREIRSLATSLAKEETRWSGRQQTLEWHYILRWVKHDQYKARLAVIHAGATLWHAREYSSHAFHESVAVFLATLTLWAYGSCYAPVSDMNTGLETRHDMPENPMRIHLDRPCDDELAQLFVREGHGMKAVLSGVGDVCAPHGPEKTLNAGCMALTRLSSWGISRRFIAILAKLAELVSEP